MSNKPVMSHDPLAGVSDDVIGDMPAVPEGIVAARGGEQQPASGVLVLPDSLGIAEVGDFHAELSSRLADAGAVSIDGSAVESIDGAGIQLLAAFVKDMVTRSSVVTWVAASDTLRRAAAQMGVRGALQLERDS